MFHLVRLREFRTHLTTVCSCLLWKKTVRFKIESSSVQYPEKVFAHYPNFDILIKATHIVKHKNETIFNIERV